MPTPAASRAMGTIRQRWPAAKPGYGIVCRNIAGTSSRSQHAYGNAIDIFGPGGTLESIYQYFSGNRGVFSVNTLCYRGRGGCTTGHYDHVHVDFHPKMAGPCGQGAATSGVSVQPAGFLTDIIVGPWFSRLTSGKTWARVFQAILGVVVIVLAFFLLKVELAGKALQAVVA